MSTTKVKPLFDWCSSGRQSTDQAMDLQKYVYFILENVINKRKSKDLDLLIKKLSQI